MKALASLVLLGVALSLASPARGEDVTMLIANLKSSDSDVRRQAAKTLTEMKSDAKPAEAALIAALKNDKDKFVRRFSAQALGEIGAEPKNAVPALKAVLKDDHKELVEAAITSLGKLGPTAVPPLIDALKRKDAPSKPEKPAKKGPGTTDHTAFVRGKAALALGEIGADAKDAVPALVDALKDVNIRTEAASALGSIGPAAKDAVKPLREAVGGKGNNRDKAFTEAVRDALKKIQTNE